VKSHDQAIAIASRAPGNFLGVTRDVAGDEWTVVALESPEALGNWYARSAGDVTHYRYVAAFDKLRIDPLAAETVMRPDDPDHRAKGIILGVAVLGGTWLFAKSLGR
jgi:hypothetical protein